MIAREVYAERRETHGALLARLRRRTSLLSIARVVAFVLGFALALVAAKRTDALARSLWIGVGGSGVAFLALVVVHDRVIRRRDRAEHGVRWAEEGLARVDHRWARDPSPGDPTSDDEHPYAADLDVFGRGSLFQSIDATKTREGRALLASWLRAPADVDEIAARQRAARALATMTSIRESLAVEGMSIADDPPAIDPLLDWASRPPAWTPTVLLRLVAIALPVATLTLLFFGGRLPVPRASWILPFLVQIVLAASYQSRVREGITAASSHADGLSRFRRMLAVVEGASFEEPVLAAMQRSIGGASSEIGALARLVAFLDARRNEVFRIAIAPFLLWDLNWGIALERWRVGAGSHLRDRLATLARIEALSSLATRAFERPDDAWPIVGSDEVAGDAPFDAAGLAHPLLDPTIVVRNDVRLAAFGALLLVTGSNMSGKSTLLRAIGTNVVLALAGAPVRARSMRLARFDVHTSMRVRDSLSEGVSHFLAELRRLKQVVDAADAATKSPEKPAVLFLLDEILHGTNSRERHLGARAIVAQLVSRRACGAISTHDLALAAMEDEHPGRVANVHFREDVTRGADGTETMTFDYVLRSGVVTSSNALRLMRIVGIDVSLVEGDRVEGVERVEGAT